MPDGTTSPHLGGQPGAHAIERAWERYGVDLAANDLARLEIDCRDGRSVLIGKDACGSERHIVRHRGVAMVAVYWPDRGNIATFLPPGREPEWLARQPKRGAVNGRSRRFRVRQRRRQRRGRDRMEDEG